MTLTSDIERDLVEATGRLTVYSLLATGFAFPTESRLEVLGSRLLPALSMLELGPDVDAAARMAATSLSTGVDGLRVYHIELFPPIASQDAPGYETGYRGEGVFQQSGIMADVAGFYRAHGLRSGGDERERPDHITVELEFMAIVAKKEALALEQEMPERVRVCRETAAAFLQDHLGCWAPAFGLRAAAVSSSPWYTSLGKLLAAWIPRDMSALGIEPAETVERPLPQEPPDDGSCGPCPAPQFGMSS